MEKATSYIFSINTGRSGSEYLTEIFRHVSGCRSFHEPEPMGNAKAMRRYARGHFKAMKEVAAKKVNVINELKRDCQIYFESNHCFINGFGWFIPQYLPEEQIGVIILKRDKLKIAKSTLRIGSSPLNSYGRDWISTPDMKAPLVKPPTTPFKYQCARFTKLALRIVLRICRSFFNIKTCEKYFHYPIQWFINYEMECVKWYVDETYAKAEAYKRQFPAIKYYEVDIEDLNSLESVQKMIAYFGCSGEDSLKDVVGKPINLRQ